MSSALHGRTPRIGDEADCDEDPRLRCAFAIRNAVHAHESGPSYYPLWPHRQVERVIVTFLVRIHRYGRNYVDPTRPQWCAKENSLHDYVHAE